MSNFRFQFPILAQRIYLDNNATTKLDPKVLAAMLPFLQEEYANAASNHEFGVSINSSVKQSRSSIAQLLGCENHEIVFTSGSTEAINLVLKGLADKTSPMHDERKRIVSMRTEHSAVLDTLLYLEKLGYDIQYADVNHDGIIDLNSFKSLLNNDTLLTCIMHVNNETGVIQPIDKISKLSHEAGSLFMTDATQSVGKLKIDVKKLNVDFLTFSGHKFHGPKGIGGLYVNSQTVKRSMISPILHGGGHERGFRSGTLNVPGIVGLGAAAKIATNTLSKNFEQIGGLRDALEDKILQSIPHSFVNGDRKNRIYNTTSISFKGVDSDALIAGLETIMVSNGSACTSTKVDPSHVLLSMGRTPEEAYSVIRFSLSKFTTEEEIESTVSKLAKTVLALRAMAPGLIQPSFITATKQGQ